PELLTALLVHMWRTVDRKALDARGKGNGSSHLRARALGRVHDLLGGVVENTVVEGFEPYADVLALHDVLLRLKPLLPSISESSRRRRRRRYGRLRGWRSAASLPSRWARSARPRQRHCRQASPSRCLPAASRFPSHPSCGSRIAGGNCRRTACAGRPPPWSGCRLPP